MTTTNQTYIKPTLQLIEFERNKLDLSYGSDHIFNIKAWFSAPKVGVRKIAIKFLDSNNQLHRVYLNNGLQGQSGIAEGVLRVDNNAPGTEYIIDEIHVVSHDDTATTYIRDRRPDEKSSMAWDRLDLESLDGADQALTTFHSVDPVSSPSQPVNANNQESEILIDTSSSPRNSSKQSIDSNRLNVNGVRNVTNIDNSVFNDNSVSNFYLAQDNSVNTDNSMRMGDGNVVSANFEFKVVNGTEVKDKLRGTAGSDLIEGFAGKDKLIGGSGDDEINGGSGNDKLVGGKGDDYLDGGAGNDKVKGGDGADVFVLSAGKDKIKDFDASEGDTLGVLKNGDYDYKFLSKGVMVLGEGSKTLVRGDTDELKQLINSMGEDLLTLM